MIDVAFTPAALDAADVAVVVDVLRATSTATQALASGYRRVLCVDSLEGAHALSGPGRVLAGERHCVRPPGFDLGNSPVSAAAPPEAELVLATTNGTPAAIAATGHAPVVILACLLNLEAVARFLADCEGAVQLVCAGTDGAPALEDVYVVGRLSAALGGPRSDAARVAEAVVRAYPSALAALEASTDAARLRAAGLAADIAFCARESVLELVPTVVEASAHVAVVAAARAARRTPTLDTAATVQV